MNKTTTTRKSPGSKKVTGSPSARAIGITKPRQPGGNVTRARG